MSAHKDSEKKKGVSWYCQFYYTDWTGARHKKKKRGFPTKKAALDWQEEFLRINCRSSDITFEAMAELYYKDRESRNDEDTIANKRSMINTHVLPYFGNRIITGINHTDIRQWQNLMLKKTNPKNGKPYAPTYLRAINSALSTVFNFAEEFYNLKNNPCHRVKSIGKKRAGKMNFWTLDDYNLAIKNEKKHAYRIAFDLLFWTGVREGECLALTPQSILHEAKSIDIRHTFKRKKGEDIFGKTKTENSERETTMPEFLYQEIVNYLDSLYEYAPDERLIYFTRTALSRELNRLADLAHIKRIRVHDLRHSHVALLIELGYSISEIAERIGDTIEEVERTYAHLYPDKQRNIAAELNRHQHGFVDSNDDINERINRDLSVEHLFYTA